MALAALTRTVQDALGNAVSGRTLEIRAEIGGAPLVSLYSDRTGATPIGNPYVLPTAMWTVYLAEGVYRIKILNGATLESDERYVVALEDVPGESTLEEVEIGAADSPYNMLASTDVIKVDTSAGPVTVNLVTAVGRTKPVKIVDAAGNAGTNAITIDGNGTETIMGQATWPLNFPYGSISLNPDQTGKWYS